HPGACADGYRNARGDPLAARRDLAGPIELRATGVERRPSGGLSEPSPARSGERAKDPLPRTDLTSALVFRMGRATSSRSRRPTGPEPRPSTQIVGTFARPTNAKRERAAPAAGVVRISGEAVRMPPAPPARIDSIVVLGCRVPEGPVMGALHRRAETA